MKIISIKGVIFGSLMDIISTNILIIPLMIYVLVSNDLLNLPESELQAALMDKLQNDQTIYILKIFIGSLCSIFGGYIAARIAKHHELLNSALASILCVAGGIYSFLSGGMDGEYIKFISLLLFSPLLSMTGGYLRLQQVRSNA